MFQKKNLKKKFEKNVHSGKHFPENFFLKIVPIENQRENTPLKKKITAQKKKTYSISLILAFFLTKSYILSCLTKSITL